MTLMLQRMVLAWTARLALCCVLVHGRDRQTMAEVAALCWTCLCACLLLYPFLLSLSSSYSTYLPSLYLPPLLPHCLPSLYSPMALCLCICLIFFSAILYISFFHTINIIRKDEEGGEAWQWTLAHTWMRQACSQGWDGWWAGQGQRTRTDKTTRQGKANSGGRRTDEEEKALCMRRHAHGMLLREHLNHFSCLAGA